MFEPRYSNFSLVFFMLWITILWFYLMRLTARIRLIWHIPAIWISISGVWPNLWISVLVLIWVKELSFIVILVLLVGPSILLILWATIWTSTREIGESSFYLILLLVLLKSSRSIHLVARMSLVLLLILLLVWFACHLHLRRLLFLFFRLLLSQLLNELLLIRFYFLLGRTSWI